MQVPVQITFHQLDPSPEVETRIHEKVAKLEQFYHGIVSCRVVVEPAAHQHGTGQTIFSVRFELGLPHNKTIVGGGSGTKSDGFDNVYTAIAAAFEATKRQLHDHAEKERQFDAPPLGTIPPG